MDFQLQRAPHSFTFQAPQALPAAKRGGRGGTITSLISEGGALGGAAAGAALGSAVPVVGTAIGGILGAGLGAFSGRLAENKVRDNRWGVGDAAKEGAVSAAFAGPLKALKYGGTATKALKGGSSLEQALAKGAARADAPSVLSQKLATGANTQANNLATKALGLAKGQKNTILKETGEKAGSIARRYGVTDYDTLKSAIKPMQSEFDEAIKNGGAITKEEFKKILSGIHSPLSKSSILSEQQVGKNIKAQADELLKAYPDGSNIPLGDVLKLRKKFDKATKSRALNEEQKGLNQNIADGLRGALQKIGEERNLITKSGLGIKDHGLELSKLYSLEKQAVKNIEGAGGTSVVGGRPLIGAATGAGAAGIPGAIAGYGATSLMNSDKGRKVIAKGAEKVVRKLSSKPNPLTSGMRMGAQGAIGAALMSGQSSASINSENNPQTMIATNTPNAASIASPYTQNNDMSTQDTSPYDISNIESNIQKLLMSGAKKDDIQTYLSIAEAVQNMKAKAAKTTEQPGYSKPSASQYSQATSALDSVEQLKQLLSTNPDVVAKNATPGQGLSGVGSLLSNSLGTAQYRAVTKNILNSIARINTGANMPASEQKFYEQTYLPQPGDTQEVVNAKISNLYQFFSPIVSYQGGGGTDAAALQAALGM